ncbi:MAG: DEAD/DEAH box helicase [bacterium]|nr:DEAD/DEAH box helicase [bacterium]
MFDQFRLAPVLLQNARGQGYRTPTPVQTAAIPPATAGLDVVATAETGSGKTAAFVLPLLHRLLKTDRGGVRGLILCPTREIALQTEEEIRKLGRATGLRSVAIYGGVGYEPQFQALRSGVDIVVATPGRLLDHLERKTVRLQEVQTLVLDEADRMLDMGFLPDLKRIIGHLPAVRQNLLYSATMPDDILALTNRLMKQPVRVAIGRLTTPPSTVEQSLYHASQQEKTQLLIRLLRAREAESVLVFTRTKHRADRLTRQLIQAGLGAAAIHGNRSQRQREAALAGFRRGSFRVLVATDIAARGLDVKGITHVINYDLPSVAEDYVHRIGRTARAGAQGYAVSLVTDDDLGALADIERALGQRIRQAGAPSAILASRSRQPELDQGGGHARPVLRPCR